MILTRLERYMIANQLRILEALYPDDAEHYAHNREAFECGYERHYDWAMEHIYDEVVSSDGSEGIADILDMFNEMQYAYEQLPDTTDIDANRIQFFGFDANTESTALAYARYFCKDTGSGERYPRIKRNAEKWNSHAPFLPMYRAMLPEWRKSNDPHTLTKSDLIRITAVKYPEQ